jgi:hypothetical protein
MPPAAHLQHLSSQQNNVTAVLISRFLDPPTDMKRPAMATAVIQIATSSA